MRAIDWADIVAAPRHANASLRRSEIPFSPGVYTWFKGSECVYLGVATNLRQRLSAHRGRSADLSRSTLRASVAVMLTGATRKEARSRPSVMTSAQITGVNAWFDEAEVAWLESATADDARDVERRLLGSWLPSLNLR